VSAVLPSALDSWTAELALLHAEVVEGVSPWLVALRELFGPMALPRGARHGDPDGLDGLSRRGPYERLSLSEWAVGLELPEEFLRRAVMSEHVFTARAFIEPRGAQVSVALLDSGPLQWGAPRLVQLAALAVLARRARHHGASFSFGFVQDPELELHSFDIAGLEVWSAARSASATCPDPAAWASALAALDAHDRWVIGAPELSPMASALTAHHVSVDEVLFAAPRRLAVQIQCRGAGTRTLNLALPPERACIRALRHPYTKPRRDPAPVVEDVAEHLGLLSNDGRRLVMAGPRGDILALHVPPFPDDTQGRTKVITPRPEHRLLTIDRIAGRSVALFEGPLGDLVLGGCGLVGRDEGSRRSVSTLFATTIPLPPGLCPEHGRRPPWFRVTQATGESFEAWLLGADGQLSQLVVPASGTASLTALDQACLHFACYLHQTLLWISGGEGEVGPTLMACPQTEPLVVLTVLAQSFPPGALDALSFGSWDNSKDRPYLAWPLGSDQVQVLDPDGRLRTVDIPRGSTLVGFDTRPIVLSADRRTVTVIGVPSALLTLETPIVEQCWSPGASCLSWRCENGEFGVVGTLSSRAAFRGRTRTRGGES